ncbi:splicing regulator RBM11-like [Callospermophilus lateralis]|uniref:splicing regulator RBM11-like n=1 Tax=Callospermophilus lateralis TaxID=76772 RepID=UPI0040388D54
MTCYAIPLLLEVCFRTHASPNSLLAMQKLGLPLQPMNENLHFTKNEETLGRSSFPMQFFPINNTALPQEYFFFHKLQRHAHNPVLQLPFYEMTAQLPSSTSGSSSLSHVPDLDAGPSSYEWTIQQPSDSDLYQMNTRKRQKQTSDSDSSTENNRGNEFSQKFRNCKKKKRY